MGIVLRDLIAYIRVQGTFKCISRQMLSKYTTLFPCVTNELKNFTMRTSLKTPYLQVLSTTIGQKSNALFNPSHTKNVKEYNGLKKKYSGANLFENTFRQKK